MKFIIKTTSEEEIYGDMKKKYGEALEKRNWVRDYSSDHKNVIEIANLEDLLEVMKEIGEELIIYQESYEDMPTIEIYDDYRE